MQRLGDILEADNKALFEVFRDFSERITVGTNAANAREVWASLQSDLVTFNASMSDVLNAFALKLFMPEQNDLKLDKGQVIYIQNKAFRIVASALNMGVRELSLEKK